MTRYVDFPAAGASRGRCVILPGRQYSPDGPLLFFAAQTAKARGWDVRQVWWQAPPRDSASTVDEAAWVSSELDAAVEDHDGPVLVVAKSLGTLAAPRAAQLGHAAAWLTPLLREPAVAEAMLSFPAHQLCVAGESDPLSDPAAFAALPGERLLVPGDHVLAVAHDPVATVRGHEAFVRAFDRWLATLAG